MSKNPNASPSFEDASFDPWEPYREYQAAIAACNGKTPTLDQAIEIYSANMEVWGGYYPGLVIYGTKDMQKFLPTLQQCNEQAAELVERAVVENTDGKLEPHLKNLLANINMHCELLRVLLEEGADALERKQGEIESRFFSAPAVAR